jgi:hypothetical protein
LLIFDHIFLILIENYTKHCNLAIIKSLKAELVCWPNAEEPANANMRNWGTATKAFKICVGFADGTIFLL